MDSSPPFLIVVSVLQGRHFHLPSDQGLGDQEAQDLVFQARFLDEELLSDPVPLTSTSPPAFTELGWEVTRRGLHQVRVERKPIKLQAFQVNPLTDEKSLIGSCIFDIRSAQESLDPKFDWKPLLNPKFRGYSKTRPEILCALQLVRSDADDQSADNSLAETASITDPSLLENDIQVREERGVFRIWDSRLSCEKDCDQMYSLSVSFTSVSQLRKLRPSGDYDGDQSQDYHFQITVFGNTFRSDEFPGDSDENFGHEVTASVCVQLAVQSISAIRAYFSLYPSIEVTLCQDDRVLASAEVPVSQILRKNSSHGMEGEFRMKRTDEAETTEPHPVLGIQVRIEPIVQNGEQAIAMECTESSLKRFMFSMDIRSVRPITLSCGTFRVRYLYATFGSLDKVTTSAVEITGLADDVPFEDGYRAFHFLSSSQKLMQTFAEVPLIVELVEETKGSHLTAICELHLHKLEACEEDGERKRLLVMKPYFLSPQGDRVAQLTVILCLRDMGTIGASSIQQANGNLSMARDADLFEQLYVTAAVEIEVWKQQQKQMFQKKLLQSVKSQNKTNSLETELRESLNRVKKREAELMEKREQMDRLEEEYVQRTQKLGDEIACAVLQVTSMYEARIDKERQTIRSLEEQNKHLASELASLKPKLRPTGRTQSLARVNSVSNPPIRSSSRS